eukprot:5859530-Amphidinium_carterae.1
MMMMMMMMTMMMMVTTNDCSMQEVQSTCFLETLRNYAAGCRELMQVVKKSCDDIEASAIDAVSWLLQRVAQQRHADTEAMNRRVALCHPSIEAWGLSS